MESETYFVTSEHLRIPWCAYGTGVVSRYSKSKPLWIKDNVKSTLINTLRSIKYQRIMLKPSAAKMRCLVEDSYKEGLRMFDTGRIYGKSEMIIGQALRNLPREDYFICTKISDVNLLQKHTPDDVLGNINLSLRYLGVDYVDLLLLHHPHGPWVDMYCQMEMAYEQGLTKAIGVSNFDVTHFMTLMETAQIMPMACQCERHPLFTNTKTLDYCRENDVIFMAHTPLGRNSPKITQSGIFIRLAEKYKKTSAQLMMRWHYQSRVIPVFASKRMQNIKENIDIFDFSLTDAEMGDIESLNIDLRLLDCLNGVDDPNYVHNL